MRQVLLSLAVAILTSPLLVGMCANTLTSDDPIVSEAGMAVCMVNHCFEKGARIEVRRTPFSATVEGPTLDGHPFGVRCSREYVFLGKWECPSF